MSEQRGDWGSDDKQRDQRVRAAAFAFLEEKTRLQGEVLPRELLAEGFPFEGQRVPLLGPQGIFKPRILNDVPLSITTVPIIEGRDRPYADELSPDNLLTYRYRGSDPAHRDDVGLRLAMGRKTPLIYFYGLVPDQYAVVWPVYVVGDNPGSLSFTVAVDSHELGVGMIAHGASLAGKGRRQYVTQLTQRRLHQEGFRLRVLKAYRDCCAVCHLRHQELLDAAHILPDGHPKGEEVVPNGLALCKLHHAAFDEADGPMLRHGLQGFDGARIHAPRAVGLRPAEDFLAERFELFKRAG